MGQFTSKRMKRTEDISFTRLAEELEKAKSVYFLRSQHTVLFKIAEAAALEL